MKTLILSLRTSTVIFRILSALILLYVIIDGFHLFDISVEKGFIFYYLVIVSIGYIISAIGMWNLRKWSVYLYLITTIALVPGFFYLKSWDIRTILVFFVVLQ